MRNDLVSRLRFERMSMEPMHEVRLHPTEVHTHPVAPRRNAPLAAQARFPAHSFEAAVAAVRVARAMQTRIPKKRMASRA